MADAHQFLPIDFIRHNYIFILAQIVCELYLISRIRFRRPFAFSPNRYIRHTIHGPRIASTHRINADTRTSHLIYAARRKYICILRDDPFICKAFNFIFTHHEKLYVIFFRAFYLGPTDRKWLKRNNLHRNGQFRLVQLSQIG